MTSPSPVRLAALAFSMLLSACGGGGSGGASVTPPGLPPVVVAPPPPAAPAPVLALSMFAGVIAGRGNLDGKGAEARFWDPDSATVDSKGNLFVIDSFLNTIRKITPDGVVTTFAGTSGTVGHADGAGAQARFNFYHQSGIAIDKNDNLYVTDVGNHLVRKVTPAGQVTTIAGQAGVMGNKDGRGPAALLRFCYNEFGCSAPGMAVDSGGTLYFVEAGNRKIRKITPAGDVVTVWGDCGYNGINDPAICYVELTGLAIDAADKLYVADRTQIRVLGTDGRMLAIAGQRDDYDARDGTGAAARFYSAQGLSIDSAGTLYTLDRNTLRKITQQGVVTTIAGHGWGPDGANMDGTGPDARFHYPAAVANDRSGNIYIVDRGNHTIRKATPAGVVTTLAGAPSQTGGTNGTGSAARFGFIGGLAFDSAGNLFVSDTDHHRIRKITPAAVVSTFAGGTAALNWGSDDGTGDAARFYNPNGLAFDKDGNLYVADTFNNAVRKITPGAAVSTLQASFTDGGTWPSSEKFSGPRGLTFDAAGTLYVADTGNNMLRKIEAGGKASTLAGLMTGLGQSIDGTGSAARFYYPWSAAVDRAGNVFVADRDSHTIRKVTPAGVVTTFAGRADAPGYVEGSGTATRFYKPDALVIDSSDNLYVSDTFNHVVRKITPSGVVTTVVGQPGMVGFRAGALPGSLIFPGALALRGRTLYIASAGGIAVVADLP